MNNAVMLEINVRSGTENILNLRQWNRKLYKGSGVCECQFQLKANETVADDKSAKFSMLVLTTNQPLTVSYVNSDSDLVIMKVNANLIIDDTFTELTISNPGEETADVFVTKVRYADA